MPRLMLASILLLLLTNVVVLSGVAYNRSGEPLSSIELTERELTVKRYYSRMDEDSSTRVLLNWRVLTDDMESGFFYGRYRHPAWLDEVKLSNLGFDLEKIKDNKAKYLYQWDTHATDAVLVLEYQGDSYRKTLTFAEQLLEQMRKSVANDPGDTSLVKKLKRYEDHFVDLKVSETRLYIIDAGLDKQELLEKYSDKSKYILLRGEISLTWDDDEIVGAIRHLYIDEMHVPLPFSQVLVDLIGNDADYAYRAEPIPPRYKVRLNVGKRLEPWIELIK